MVEEEILSIFFPQFFIRCCFTIFQQLPLFLFLMCTLWMWIKVSDKSFLSLWPGFWLTKAKVANKVLLNLPQINPGGDREIKNIKDFLSKKMMITHQKKLGQVQMNIPWTNWIVTMIVLSVFPD